MRDGNIEQQPDLDADLESVGALGSIVEQEAHRILSQAQLEPDPELVAQGWERRFFTDGRRLQEVVDLYTELGYEVHVEPLREEQFEDDCADCGLIALLKFSTVYTR